MLQKPVKYDALLNWHLIGGTFERRFIVHGMDKLQLLPNLCYHIFAFNSTVRMFILMLNLEMRDKINPVVLQPENIDSPRNEKTMRAFFVCATILFEAIFLGAILNADGSYASGQPIVSFAAFLCCISLLFGVAVYIGKHAAFFEKHCRSIVWIITGGFAILAILFAYIFECGGNYEIKFVNEGALCLVQHGDFSKQLHIWNKDIAFSYQTCFLTFSNIYDTMLYLAGLYGVFSRIGIPDSSLRLAGTIYTCLKTAAAIPLLFYTVKWNRDVKTGLYAVLLFSICLPILVSSPIAYHYTITFLYPLLCVFLYTAAIKSARRGVCPLCLIGIAVIAAIGFCIAKTPLIVVIAIILEVLILPIARPRKSFLMLAAAAVTLAALLSFLVGSHQRKHHFDARTYDAMHLPSTTWIYVGLNEASLGYFDYQDQLYYWSFPSLAQKEAALKAGIHERLSNMGVWGVIRHLYKKAVFEFGTGTYSSDIVLRADPVRPNMLHNYVSARSEEVKYYQCLTQGVHLSYLFLLVVSVYIRTRNRLSFNTSVPWIALTGLILATLINEAYPRHLYNFVPLLIYCASFGLSDLQEI